jgi:hypothetical protein
MKGSFAMVFKVMQIFVGFLLAGIMCGVCLEGQQVPSAIDAPPGTRLLMQVKGEGVQVYVCTEGTWTLKAPDAKLLDTQDKVIGEHFAGPTWKLNDGSQVRGKMIASQARPMRAPSHGCCWRLSRKAVAASSRTWSTFAVQIRVAGPLRPVHAVVNGASRIRLATASMKNNNSFALRTAALHD